jgi:CRP-like cAMP-binding protein
MPPRDAQEAKSFCLNLFETDDPPQDPTENRILRALPPEELKRLLPSLERVAFRANEILFSAGESAPYIYFPQEAIISLLGTTQDGRTTEVSLTGPEGVVGIREILGARTYCYTAVVEIPGSCLRLPSETFRTEFRSGGALQSHLLNYLRYLLLQISQAAVCNRLHRVKERLARRLLMIQDRVGKAEFPMTHESLSLALGTPRSEVSFAAEALRYVGIIGYERGTVTILNREKLESASCECYGIIHREFLTLG